MPREEWRRYGLTTEAAHDDAKGTHRVVSSGVTAVVASAVVYVVAYRFERGFAAFFDIPTAFVSVGVDQILAVSYAVLLPAFLLLYLGSRILWNLPIFKGPLRSHAYRLIYLAVFTLVVAVAIEPGFMLWLILGWCAFMIGIEVGLPRLMQSGKERLTQPQLWRLNARRILRGRSLMRFASHLGVEVSFFSLSGSTPFSVRNGLVQSRPDIGRPSMLCPMCCVQRQIPAPFCSPSGPMRTTLSV